MNIVLLSNTDTTGMPVWMLVVILVMALAVIVYGGFTVVQDIRSSRRYR